MRPSVSATPLDWAAEQIGLARIALARARWTGQTPRGLGVMLTEAAATALSGVADAFAAVDDELAKALEERASAASASTPVARGRASAR